MGGRKGRLKLMRAEEQLETEVDFLAKVRGKKKRVSIL